MDTGRDDEAWAGYRGPFLSGIYLPDWSAEFEEWVYATREFLAARARTALLRLAEAGAANGNFKEATKRAEAAYSLPGTPELELPDPAISYPAAVEVAAYRIVLEAVSNVVRHAQARGCQVSLKATGVALELTVRDDGVGLEEPRIGVGLAAMRERAEELGGALSVTPHQPGVEVRASLPLRAVERRARPREEA